MAEETQEGEKNYGYLLRDDQKRVCQKRETKRRQEIEERERSGDKVMGVDIVLTELDDVRAQGSQEGMSCRRKERQDTEDLEAFWNMIEITFVELNDHVIQAIRGQASLPQLELLINEIEGKETFIYNVLKLGQVGLGHEMFDIMIRQLRSLKRMRDEAWRCLNVKVSPEKGTRGGKQDKRTV